MAWISPGGRRRKRECERDTRARQDLLKCQVLARDESFFIKQNRGLKIKPSNSSLGQILIQKAHRIMFRFFGWGIKYKRSHTAICLLHMYILRIYPLLPLNSCWHYPEPKRWSSRSHWRTNSAAGSRRSSSGCPRRRPTA